MGTTCLILFEGTLLVCLVFVILYWRAKQKIKMLTEEYQRILAELETERREHKKHPENAPIKPELQKDFNAQEQLYSRLCQLMNTPEHIFTDPDLDRCKLARLLGTNEHYISDAVSACTKGGSINDFINGYRLRYAVNLLITTDDSIALIAELSGFSRRSFYRVFDEAYSTSPSEFRKTARVEAK